MGKWDELHGDDQKLKFWWLPHYSVCRSRHKVVHMKAMTNLDSILKDTDVTLPTKGIIVKTVVFPVVMYGRER